MKLYVSNCTLQDHDFCYRVPESGRERRQVIPAGQQRQVHDDAPIEVLKGIVAQHEAYGLVDASTIHKEHKFVGMAFSFEKPISMDDMMTVADHNTGVLTDVAIERQKQTASAIRSNIDNDEIGVSSVSIEVVQDDKPNSPVTGKPIAQGVEVIEAGQKPRRGPKSS